MYIYISSVVAAFVCVSATRKREKRAGNEEKKSSFPKQREKKKLKNTRERGDHKEKKNLHNVNTKHTSVPTSITFTKTI